MNAVQFDVSVVAKFRDAEASDVPMIADTWLKSFRRRSKWAAGLPEDLYFSSQRETIRRILNRSSVLVACDPTSPSEVWSYFVFEEVGGHLVIHFAYTKHALRRFGLVNALLTQARRRCHGSLHHSHKTDLGSVIAKKKGSKFNPLYATNPLTPS